MFMEYPNFTLIYFLFVVFIQVKVVRFFLGQDQFLPIYFHFRVEPSLSLHLLIILLYFQVLIFQLSQVYLIYYQLTRVNCVIRLLVINFNLFFLLLFLLFILLLDFVNFYQITLIQFLFLLIQVVVFYFSLILFL